MSTVSSVVLAHNVAAIVTWDSSADCHVVPYYVHLLIGICVACVAVFAVVGNLLVLCTFARYSSLRTSSNLLIINLTVADFLLATFNLPVFAMSSFKGCWMLGYIGCQVYGLTTSISGLVTINTLAIVALDRYIVVVHGLTRMHRMTKSTTGYIIFTIWSLSIFWSFLPLIGLGSYRLEGMGTSCTFNYVDQGSSQRWFFMCLVTFNFFIPLLVIAFSYWRIFLMVKCVKEELTFLQRGNSNSAGIKLLETQSEFKTAVTVIVIIAIFCTAWTPYVIISSIGLFGQQGSITPLASMFPNILAKVSTVSNPILYTIGHPEIRKKLKMMARCRNNSWWRPVLMTTLSSSYGHTDSHGVTINVRVHLENNTFDEKLW